MQSQIIHISASFQCSNFGIVSWSEYKTHILDHDFFFNKIPHQKCFLPPNHVLVFPVHIFLFLTSSAMHNVFQSVLCTALEWHLRNHTNESPPIFILILFFGSAASDMYSHASWFEYHTHMHEICFT